MSVFRTFSATEEPATIAAPRSRRTEAWRTPAGPTPWRLLAVAVVPLLLVYLTMLNRYWVPSGDGEVYTCIARSLVKGTGLTFNGSRAAIAPPGWPIVLSLAMRISPEFLFLKSITIACMTAAMALAFLVLRRLVSDRMAAGGTLMAGTLSTLYPLTFWMHTEALFCVLGFGALLIAFRIAERRALPAVEVPLLLALLAAGAFTRWPGVLHAVLVVPILLSGRRRPWARPTRWALVALVCLVSAGTFWQTRSFLALTSAEQRAARVAGGTAEVEGGDAPIADLPTTLPATVPAADEAIIPADDASVPTMTTLDIRPAHRGPVGETVHRALIAGRWFAWSLWQPTRFGQSVSAIDAAGLAFGWLVIALLGAAMIGGIARRNYFWIGLAIYTGGLCVLWPNPNARYFVPVAPFIIVGVLLGIAELNARLDARLYHRRAARSDEPPAEPGHLDATDARTGALRVIGGWKLMAIAFVAATLAANLPLLAIDVWVFRSRDFYGKYEAGANKELIAAAQMIRAHPTDGAICVNERYENMGRPKWSKFGMRALHLLTDHVIIGLPRRSKYYGRPTSDDVRDWLRKGVNDVDYCVFQSEWKPWRVWHLRLSPSFQKRLTGKAAFANAPSGGWELYARKNARYVRTPTSDDIDMPTRVPGL